jgi:tRNA(Ile)-lysidine synthase
MTDLTLPNKPFPRNARLIVGVSGGSDSMGLLQLLLEQLPKASKRLVVVHVNYGLRGQDSKKDEKAVYRFCLERKISFMVLRVKNFNKRVKEEKRSVQDLAREIRYFFFRKMVQEKKAWGVAVAHHLEDQAETILDRLLRGSGAKGLSGLRRVQTLLLSPKLPSLKIWRPLLSYSKSQIQDYLTSRGTYWREDKSNHDKKYRRNQIRKEIIPFLSRWNPRLPEVLARVGEITATEDKFLESLLSSTGRKILSRWKKSSYYCQAELFRKIPLALQRRWARFAAEKLTPQARGLPFERVEEIIRLWNGRIKGPRDIGFGLTAGEQKNQAFLIQKNMQKTTTEEKIAHK